MSILTRPARYAVIADLPGVDAYLPDVRPARRRRTARRTLANLTATLSPSTTGFRVRLVDQRTGQVLP